ncbi:hypothetical protein HY493_05170 [Candidatus Woesearchaeota archaeon]|nr:hypothetical protein [Candidatus Woesearchaeota archaeon]
MESPVRMSWRRAVVYAGVLTFLTMYAALTAAGPSENPLAYRQKPRKYDYFTRMLRSANKCKEKVFQTFGLEDVVQDK